MTNYKYVPPTDRIKIHPLLGVRANAQDHGAGWRFWVICRMLDAKSGSGVVEASAVNKYLQKHGVTSQQVRRWLGDATKMGFVKKVVRYTGVVILLYASEVNVAIKLGCNGVDVRFAEMDMSQILGCRWRSEVWKAYIAVNFNGKTISRERLQKITGIERHQQFRLEKGMGIKNIRNIVLTGENANASTVAGMRDSGRAAYSYRGKLVFRLPDTRIVEGIDTYGRDRSKVINEEIAVIAEKSGLLEQEASFSYDKLFHSDDVTAYEYSQKNFTKNDDWEVFYIEPEKGDYTGGVIWKMMKKEVK